MTASVDTAAAPVRTTTDARAPSRLHPADHLDHPAFRIVETGNDIDTVAAERAVRDLLLALGRDPTDEHLAGTPRRVAHAFAELLHPEPFDLTTFPNDQSYDELVLVRDISFNSLCEHHLLPFRGVAHVGYLPKDRILGLSKFARIVRAFAADLQTQERLTMQIAGWLDENLHPKGVGVVIEADHLCMSLRGVQADGAHTTTSALRGRLRDDARSRQEFLSLAARRA
jgi:GTP cyclohydrolase I